MGLQQTVEPRNARRYSLRSCPARSCSAEPQLYAVRWAAKEALGVRTRQRHLWLVILLSAAASNLGLAQTPRRFESLFSQRDTLTRVAKADSSRVGGRTLLLMPVLQDSSRQCRSTMPDVLFGGAIGFLVGSARYEKGLEHGDGDFAPWLSIPSWSDPTCLAVCCLDI